MEAAEKMTKQKAVRLGRALLKKLEERNPALAIEACIAYGLPLKEGNAPIPPDWALAAARIALKEIAKPFNSQVGQVDATAGQAGVLVGMANAWSTFINQSTQENQALEQAHPELIEFRTKLGAISQPGLSGGKLLEAGLANQQLSSQAWLSYSKGQQDGTRVIFDKSGELAENDSIRAEVCYYIWLYWQDIPILGSVTELKKFLSEFEVSNLKLGYLAKICHAIGLKLKLRGRPAKKLRK